MKNLSPKILIRCDSSSRIGLGHVTRCIALAQAFKDAGIESVFACKTLDGNGIKIIKDQGFSVVTINSSDFKDCLLYTSDAADE